MPRPVPPSDNIGEFESRWVAPFVHYSVTRVSGKASFQVRRYSSTGALESETDSLFSYSSPFGFCFVSGPFGHQTFHGMYGDWHCTGDLETNGEQINALASPNGRTLLRLMGPEKHGGSNAVVVYVMGRKVSTLGPFPGMDLTSIRMCDDGSVGALFVPREGAGEPEALLTDASGVLSMRIRAPGAFSIQPAPDGRGALLWRTDGGLEYAASPEHGRELSPPLKLAPWFAHWMVGSKRVLLGNEMDSLHVLFDLDERRVVWKAKAPAHLAPDYSAVFGEYVFQSGLEAAPTEEEPAGSVLVIHALDSRTGNVLAQWKSSPPRRHTWQDMGKLMVRGGHLYFVTDEVFTEISLDDVRSGSGDWKPVR